MATEYYLREAASDVSGARIMAAYRSGIEVQLDAALAAGAVQATAFSFLTPLLGKTLWQAGAYALTLEIAEGAAVRYTAEIWRADEAGAEIEQIGAQPEEQSGSGTKEFTFTGAQLATEKTDRLKLKLLATNTSATAATLSLRCSASRIVTPSEPVRATRSSGLVRGRFIGVRPRPGEAVPDADGFTEYDAI